MFDLRKVQPGEGAQPRGRVAVLLEPLPGRTDTDVLAVLRGGGASHVEVLAPGFISAEVERAALGALGGVACVHEKPTQQLRGPYGGG